MEINRFLQSQIESKLFKKKAKGKMIGMEALGWGTWILFIIAIS
jgi:hypothetical protein